MQPGMGASVRPPPLLLLILIALVPLRVVARVDIVPALLVHEEHLPPISHEPTYTVSRFVNELLQMQGDEIYGGRNRLAGTFGRYAANSVQEKSAKLVEEKSARLTTQYKEPVVDGKNFGSYNIKRKPKDPIPTPFTNVRINNSFRQLRLLFPSHTQAIFKSGPRAESLVALPSSTVSSRKDEEQSTSAFVTTTNAPITMTTTATLKATTSERNAASAEEESLRPTEPAKLTVESLLAEFFSRPASPAASSFRLPSANSVVADPTTTSTTSAPTFSSTTPVELTTVDVVDLIRKELKALKPSPRPFGLRKASKKSSSEKASFVK
ncbi:Hypothetical predicted protein [Cloeon dipterum]|uniref:Uncharacterized protein n=1 Tax=Cloeon dipterum TaxID=197152 RepID=A0A8S1E1V9_9INSE|nr:Hypothetical predicted protein [Cloeon dipterum]